jgi:riboflavin biosynthesis pyrimidine reductase
MCDMRALLPVPGPTETELQVDVHAHYGAHWLESGGIRANMIVSADGAAAASGRSAGLQVPADHLVFAALRDLADVVLVGWATAATENYGPARPDAQQRERAGLGPDLPIAVVSRTLAIDPSSRLFASARPFVVTCAASDERRRDELAAYADVLVCGDDDIDYALAREAFAERALHRVLCEGGPRLLARVMAGGDLDELCLTVSPRATGPGAPRVVAGGPWPDGRSLPMRLIGLLEDDGALFLRYSVGAPWSR